MVEPSGWFGLLGALWLGVSLLVGLDASRNSPHSSVLWGLAVLVGGLLGLILYVILGREPETDAEDVSVDSPTDLVRCPSCHALEGPDRSVCRFCDAPLEGA